MKRLFTSALLTVAAVPFLMAAPNAAKKSQNQPATAKTNKVAVKKAHKKNVKKSQAKMAPEAAPSAQK